MAGDDILDQLEKLGRLRDTGVLSPAEFDAQKARLLGTPIQPAAAQPAAVLPNAGGGAGAKPSPAAPMMSKINFQAAADTITSGLGLQKIESFNLGNLFSEVFRPHDQNEMENLLSVGAPLTTPPLDASMGKFPNPWIFFRAFGIAIAAYLVFYFALNTFQNPNLLPGLIMIGSFAVPLSVLVLFYEINTPRNVSVPRVIQFLVVGGSVSLLLSLVLFDLSQLDSYIGPPAAGIVEECGKLAAVILTWKMIPKDRYPYRLNALLFGAAVGTGFAAFESAGYALVQTETLDEMIALIMQRGVMSPFGHIVWTAIAASAYWEVRGGTMLSGKFLRLFAAPVALHFLWNMDLPIPFYVKGVILGFIAWVIVVSLVQTGLKEIAQAAEEKRAADEAARSTESPSADVVPIRPPSAG